jgi:GTPase involved in cell partitioning and DNA repair
MNFHKIALRIAADLSEEKDPKAVAEAMKPIYEEIFEFNLKIDNNGILIDKKDKDKLYQENLKSMKEEGRTQDWVYKSTLRDLSKTLKDNVDKIGKRLESIGFKRNEKNKDIHYFNGDRKSGGVDIQVLDQLGNGEYVTYIYKY